MSTSTADEEKEIAKITLSKTLAKVRTKKFKAKIEYKKKYEVRPFQNIFQIMICEQGPRNIGYNTLFNMPISNVVEMYSDPVLRIVPPIHLLTNAWNPNFTANFKLLWQDFCTKSDLQRLKMLKEGGCFVHKIMAKAHPELFCRCWPDWRVKANQLFSDKSDWPFEGQTNNLRY
jgi:hypothetical protein